MLSSDEFRNECERCKFSSSFMACRFTHVAEKEMKVYWIKLTCMLSVTWKVSMFLLAS